MVTLSKEYNQVSNLVKFNVNFSKFISNNELFNHDPNYILEKYEHWIGFSPVVEHKLYTPDDMTDFFNKYWKVWRPDTNSINSKLKNILMYLYSTQSMDLIVMTQKFEEYIGPLNMISPFNKRGLHYVSMEFAEKVLNKNSDHVKMVLRDLKIGNII